MKKLLFATLTLSVFFGSCKKDDGNGGGGNGGGGNGVVELSGDISADKTLDAGTKYLLKGFVYVTDGATLHIPAGTVIMGDKATKGTLIITRGAKIDAMGQVDKPIIFTSAQAAGARSQGDWGGIIILGKAPVNLTGGEGKIEGGLVPTNGGDEKKYIYYGGTDASDNSGTLKYVRVEFGGIPFSPDNEINGVTCGGVGNGTTISYVQVYRSGDDAFEFFGGTVNCDHIVATYTWDDDFDTDNGFSGKIQFGLCQRIKTTADVSGSNGFESDNDANGSTNSPKTAAMFSNMTIMGPITSGASTSGINANFQHGAQIRRNSAQSIYNSLFVGFPIGVYIDGTKGSPTILNTGATGVEGPLMFRNNIIAGCPTAWKSDAANTADSVKWKNFKSQASNSVLPNVEDVKMTDPFKFSSALVAASAAGRPNFTLAAGSPALTGADFTGLSGFQTVSFRGAFDGANDWTATWTTWSAENTEY